MKTTTIILLLCCFLLSCDEREFESASAEESFKAACGLCHKSPREMEWFRSLLTRAETDITLRGDIYAIQIDGSTIFVNQPMIVSCLACDLYDCGGNKISPAAIDHEKLVAGMTSQNRIFQSYH